MQGKRERQFYCGQCCLLLLQGVCAPVFLWVTLGIQLFFYCVDGGNLSIYHSSAFVSVLGNHDFHVFVYRQRVHVAVTLDYC